MIKTLDTQTHSCYNKYIKNKDNNTKKEVDNMIKEYQVTLICETGQYRPVSAIVKADTDDLAKVGKVAYTGDIRKRGIIKICEKRYWGNADLKRYHYTKVKMREYDKEKIAKENAERYERIKRERGWVKDENAEGEQ